MKTQAIVQALIKRRWGYVDMAIYAAYMLSLQYRLYGLAILLFALAIVLGTVQETLRDS